MRFSVTKEFLSLNRIEKKNLEKTIDTRACRFRFEFVRIDGNKSGAGVWGPSPPPPVRHWPCQYWSRPKTNIPLFTVVWITLMPNNIVPKDAVKYFDSLCPKNFWKLLNFIDKKTVYWQKHLDSDSFGTWCCPVPEPIRSSDWSSMM